MPKYYTLFNKSSNVNNPSTGPPRVLTDKKKVLSITKEEKKLQNLIKVSQRSLYKLKSVFPFDLFPDEIEIEETKVNVIDHMFFLTKQYHSIPIEEIKDVYVVTVPFFSSLKLTYESLEEERTAQVNFLKRDEAIKARRIIQGLVIAIKKKIDLTRIAVERLVVELEELGRASEKED